jgi:hypothetical protein
VAQNPIYQLAVEELKLNGTVDMYNTDTYVFRDCTTGTDMTSEGRNRKEEFNDLYDDICSPALVGKGPMSTGDSFQDQTIREALEEVGWKGPSRAIDAAVEWLVVDFELGESADYASYTKNICGDVTKEHFGETDYLISDQRGFESVTNLMCSKLDPQSIKLYQTV